MPDRSTWTPTQAAEGALRVVYVLLDDARRWDRNPKRHDIPALVASLQRHGFRDPPIYDAALGAIVAGNGRLEALCELRALGADPPAGVALDGAGRWCLPVLVGVDAASRAQAEAFGIDHNALTLAGAGIAAEVVSQLFDPEAMRAILAELDAAPVTLERELADAEVWLSAHQQAEGDSDHDEGEPGDAEPEPKADRAAELAMEWKTAPGQVWEIASRTVPGRCHRVMCGDSTVGADVARLMGGISGVSLLHADPPYGMGKEADGIANDNLYREKLDAFQMAWWRTWRPFLADNASAYIWGNAADLWRLWYVGGLSASERMTVRNEIVWDKGSNLGMSSSELRSYSPAGGERCLFCVLGDQEFNNDADNYWEGWEPIRRYLCTQRDRVGWTNRDVAGFFGFHPRMADHWFSRSQWSMPRPEQYARLQQEAMGSAFLRNYDTIRHEYDTLKKEYDDLRRAFYATRAYFDNTHDNMTDVWEFPRVTGEDRHGHATPKPVAMVARAIKSSCPPGAIVAEPFLGSGTTIVAAEREGRICVGCELSPGYVAVVLQRLADMGLKPRLVEG